MNAASTLDKAIPFSHKLKVELIMLNIMHVYETFPKFNSVS